MNNSYRGKSVVRRPVVWVIGASRGVGRALALEFSSIGCHVCLSGRDGRLLRALSRDISRRGGVATVYPCDIRNNSAVDRTERRIRREAGPVDVLLANAGITVFNSFLSTPSGTVRDILRTNLEGELACVKAVLPSMIRRKYGWIFNIGSVAAKHVFRDSSAYTASKAGMAGAMDVLREEVRRSGIRVVNVHPGPVDTAMWSRETRRKFSGRMMRPASIAEAVLALYCMPPDVMPEELVLRPMLGDLGGQ